MAMIENIANSFSNWNIDALLPGGAAAEIMGLIENGDNTYSMPLH
jgi:hypothetical protein